MKPVVIIAIAVGCSVAAVFGVLFAWQGIATMQAQEVYNEYQEELREVQFISEHMQAVENQLNREVCVDMFGNVMSVQGERNSYQDCLDYGFWNAVESQIRGCEIYDTLLVLESCQSRTMKTFYDSMMPKVQALTQEQRDYLTYDKATMEEFSIDWEFWGGKYMETQLKIGEMSAKQTAKDQAYREKMQAPCSDYEEAERAYNEMMKGYQAQISAGEISYKDLDRLESQAKQITGYYDGMSIYMMNHC